MVIAENLFCTGFGKVVKERHVQVICVHTGIFHQFIAADTLERLIVKSVVACAGFIFRSEIGMFALRCVGIADSVEIVKAHTVGRKNVVTFAELVPVAENHHLRLPRFAGTGRKEIILDPFQEVCEIFFGNERRTAVSLPQEHVAEADADCRDRGDSGRFGLFVLCGKFGFLEFGIKGVLSPVVGITPVKAHAFDLIVCAVADKNDGTVVAEIHAGLS